MSNTPYHLSRHTDEGTTGRPPAVSAFNRYNLSAEETDQGFADEEDMAWVLQFLAHAPELDVVEISRLRRSLQYMRR
jgi:hypothetical protein